MCGVRILPDNPWKYILKDHFVPNSGDSGNSVSTTVIERAKRGDQEAFQQIAKLYAGLVYCWCRKGGLSAEDAEDVGQHVFMSVARYIGTFRRSKPEESFRGWLRTITKSRIIDFRRTNPKREIGIGGPEQWEEFFAEQWAESDSVVELREDTIMLYKRAIDLLSSEFGEKDSRAFTLLVLDGLTAREVAEELGVSANSVYIAKSRILKRLREEFRELLEDI